MRAFFADRARTPGDIDILVNNAGISMFGPTAEVEMAAYDKMFASNVRAPLFLVGALAPGLVERGRGSIISLSSMAGGLGLAGGAAYGATKASLEAMTRAWPAEYSASGVRVSAVAPGPVYTPTPLGRRVHHRAGGRDADAPRIASRGHRVPRVRPRELHHRRDDRRRRRTSSGLDRHDAVWAQAHDDPDHVNHHQGAGHV